MLNSIISFTGGRSAAQRMGRSAGVCALVALLSQGFISTAMATEELGMTVRVFPSSARPGIVIMVSKADHCFHDLVLFPSFL